VATLDEQIDDLYRKPLDEFVQARSELARQLKGADAQRVKQLKKPTVVPWAVNQVYWHARSTFDRVQRAGAELRRAQIAALKGRAVDLRPATSAHHEAMTAAVAQATRYVDAAGAHPSRDALAAMMRTFEALSLAAEPAEPLGRLTQPLQPGGFEMLAGVPLKPGTPTPRSRAAEHAPLQPSDTEGRSGSATKKQIARDKRVAEEARAQEREQAAAARRREAAIKKAEADLKRARERETQARRAWEQSRDQLQQAERALASAQSKP
jgi:hypothetical protein